jgi:polyferredoxin
VSKIRKAPVGIEVKHRSSLRRLYTVRVSRLIVQIAFLIIANEGLSLILPLPVIGLSYPWTSFPSALDMLQVMIILLIPPLLPLASIIIFNTLLGRFFCGWICPFGFIQDIIHYAVSSKNFISASLHSKLKYVKYVFLIIILLLFIGWASLYLNGQLSSIANLYGRGVAYMPYTSFSPDSTLFGTIPYLFSLGLLPNSIYSFFGSINATIFIRYLILLLILLACAKVTRFWCRYICPMGAINALFSSRSVLGIYREVGKCDECGICNKICPVQIDVVNANLGRLDSKECIMCFECVAACHTKAINVTFKKR